ncbi:polysaccharide biosynthesis/export family protein [Synechococcus sp. MEDNS5]|uniref:polysaccharide biosynthesis/export family protein n=1 Tax=Synechococcus sp. MEDNS5 TaxID=1442554 RepID=UPI0018613FBB|nr:polysaccharide biosynthesis/export family protein [Synechococcus sp. MEDNS5]QNJ04956.1 polysaccharide biosynthesis/export family protein [Synechococcus sp. MEDNS5]
MASEPIQDTAPQNRSRAGADGCAPDPNATPGSWVSRTFGSMKTLIHQRRRTAAWLGSAVLASSFGLPAAMAQQQLQQTLELRESVSETVTTTTPGKSPAPRPIPTAPIQDAYILGPGDAVVVELLDVPEYSGVFSIGPDGTLYLPRLRSLYVEGLTVEELRYFLTQQFSAYVRDPQVFVSPAAYRPIRVYIGGEVQRPGYYYLSGQQGVVGLEKTLATTSPGATNLATGQVGVAGRAATAGITNNPANQVGPQIQGVKINRGLRLPTVFDALRTAGGVTPFSKLSEVSVTRKRPLSIGGGKMRTQLNFLELITDGNETQNIRLFDGDTVVVARSPVELREQIIKAGQTNLSPDFVQVFVTGRVRSPGSKVLPQGASLDQALAAAGGQKLLRGRVEFVRFNRDGSTDKRKFFLGGANPAGSYKNPILMAGDVVRVNESPLSATVTVLNELTGPAVGIYSVYSLFRDFQ